MNAQRSTLIAQRSSLAALLASALAASAQAALPDVIFAIGKDDQSPAEFALAEGAGWQKYKDAVKSPVCYIVGKSKPESDWPYIHPNTHDKWAGGKTHPFAIRFALSEAPTQALTLVIGQVNALESPTLCLDVNGKTFERRPAPDGSGDSSGHAEGRLKPDRTLFTIPSDRFKAGDNEFVLTLEKGSWIIYDFVLLCAKIPKAYEPPDITPRAAALRSGEYGLFNEIVFATRNHVKDGHWYANFGYYCTSPERTTYGTQGRLAAWNLHTGALRLLVDDPEGGVRDPCLSYDAKTILFSYRKAGAPHYHLYEIGADGGGLRQLTDGGYDDIEPCYLPDGGIVFVSGRAQRWVNCWLTQVATVHRCDADGRNIRMLSANIEHDNTPWPLPDGRLIYMRWEYVDRSQVNYHHLWTMNPDGTQHSIFFGNLHPGGLFIDAKPIPRSTDVLFIDSPGHGSVEHKGFVARVSAKQGPDVKQNLRHISKTNSFRDPWPVSDDLYLAARDRDLVLLDDSGTEKILFTLPESFKDCDLHEPRPIFPRVREPLIADKTDLSDSNGVFFLENVYEGRQMVDVEKGTVKRLMIVESLPKPINFTGGMDPLSYVGTFTLPRVLGTVPVEPDGSAHFSAPALRPLFFVALDANGRCVKRMQSFTQLMPGERQGCTGCHEERASAPRPYASAGAISAARRKPSAIDASGCAFDVPDFPRHIQPVLDRNCVRCHNPDARKGGVDLCGDHGPMFSMGYYTLAAWAQITDGRNFAKSNYAPYALGSGGSPLMKKLDGTHHEVKPSPQEVATVALWLDASAPYPGTYAALACGMIGGYEQNNQTLENDKEWPATRDAQPVFKERCASCHTKDHTPLPSFLSDENGLSFWTPDMKDPRLRNSRHAVFNLSRPEKSLFLRAPLSKAAGGLGLCKSTNDVNAIVFASAEDPAYRALLAMIEAGRKRLEEIKRFDMPGFKPRPEYLREMKRYGVLPASFDPDKDSVDIYALDRLYWDSFIYRPAKPAL
jgi:mono/diheme cytochrome c family protein